MKELLSPAGNMECLYAAIAAGADAVYLGGKSFGARAFAGNFTKEELKEAVEYAHLYDVKLYITVNTIIYNNEIDSFIEYIKGVVNLTKKDMKLNNATPKLGVDPETYDVTVDGELITCEPAKELPLAQRYFLF